ncbi:MAG: EAL domain-containing protein [Lachnospiraceae bacterium]|nr:EAL domain-containing protein [Lachnospiraceae bacterium]
MDELSRISGMVFVCVDDDGKCCASSGSLPGITDEEGWEEQLLMHDIPKELLDNVSDGSMEDVSTTIIPGEDGGTGYRFAAISIRMDGKTISRWLVVCSGELSEKEFFDRTDFLRHFCKEIYEGRLSEIDAHASVIRDKDADDIKIRKAFEADAKLLNLLANNDSAEGIMHAWIEIVGSFFEVDSAQLYRFQDEGKECNILTEIEKKDIMIPVFSDEIMDAQRKKFNVGQLQIFSEEEIHNPENKELLDAGIKCALSMPILMRPDGTGNIVAVFKYYETGHEWSQKDVKFITDAGRLLQNILLSRINKNSIAGSFRAIEDILNNIGVSFYMTNREGDRVIFVNRMLIDTFDIEWKEGKLRSMIAEGIGIKENENGFELYNPRLDRWYELSRKEIEWVDGSEAVLYSLYDVTDRKLHQSKIEQQAFTDFLTGLYNRMCCERDLARLIDEVEREGTKGALVYIDLDDFKHINDGLGHQYGDILLKLVSDAMRSVSGIENNCYRMGGDEFVILIPPASFGRFEGILSDIKYIFSRPFFLKDSEYYCTSSMGVVTFPDNGATVQGLMRKADIAMYEAKKDGKNRMSKYNVDQDKIAGRRLDMEKNMRDAEDTGYDEFQVYYQPIIDVEDGLEECVGAEALVRWDNKQLGFVSPEDFIPLAEYLGLINPIGDHVLLEACRTVKSWNERGYDYMKVNVNLSVVQLLQNNIVEIIENALKETALNPRNLTLEVTESLAINDMQRMKGILTKIKSLGVSIALDDFGTGYSSLNHIREIPLDIIKVDQSFVKDLADDAYSQAFVKMVAELAETRGLKVCVEGIETPEQYNVLKGLKVKYIQGFYFDKPLPKNVFEKKYLI